MYTIRKEERTRKREKSTGWAEKEAADGGDVLRVKIKINKNMRLN